MDKKEFTRLWKQNNRDKVRAARKRYTQKYPEKIKAENKRFRENNPEYRKKYYEEHKEQEKAYNKNKTPEQKARKLETNRIWKSKRYKEDPGYRLRAIVTSGIKRYLKGGRKGNKTEAILGYTMDDLIKHLEAQFEDWMTWDNLGLTSTEPRVTWQIDHIRPVNTFNITDIHCEAFKECWKLENLRPLDSYYNTRRPLDGSDVLVEDNNINKE